MTLNAQNEVRLIETLWFGSGLVGMLLTAASLHAGHSQGNICVDKNALFFSSHLQGLGEFYLFIFSSSYLVRKKDVYVQVISLSGLAKLDIFGQPERVKFRGCWQLALKLDMPVMKLFVDIQL